MVDDGRVTSAERKSMLEAVAAKLEPLEASDVRCFYVPAQFGAVFHLHWEAGE